MEWRLDHARTVEAVEGERLKGQSHDQMRTNVTNYFNANPQVRDEINGVRQAASDFRDRCNAPVPDGPMG